MASPKTILQLAGAAPAPHALATSAVVMIDAQMEYIIGQMPLTGIEAALEEGARLLGAARDQGRPIVHIQQNGNPGGLFDPDGPTFPIAEAVAPEGDEPVVAKTLPNAFAKTELEDVLGGLGVESVIFAGFMTHMCVSSTVRAAVFRIMRPEVFLISTWIGFRYRSTSLPLAWITNSNTADVPFLSGTSRCVS